jgi:hypothetical protein
MGQSEATSLRRERGYFVLTTGTYRRYYRTVMLPLAVWDFAHFLLTSRGQSEP